MTLKQWQNNGWLKPHKSSAEEIGNLLEIVKRDLKDSGEEAISTDWRFGIAYNAALKLCTILLYAEGHRPEKTLAHYRTLQALPLILGSKKKADAEYLDACLAVPSETPWSMTLWAVQLNPMRMNWWIL